MKKRGKRGGEDLFLLSFGKKNRLWKKGGGGGFDFPSDLGKEKERGKIPSILRKRKFSRKRRKRSSLIYN